MSEQERGQAAEETKIEQPANQPVSTQNAEVEEIVEVQQKIEPLNEISQPGTQQPKRQQQKTQNLQPANVTRASLPKINNLKYEYKGHQKYDWDIGLLDGNSCIQKMQSEKLPDFHEFSFENEVDILITAVNNVKGHLFYTLDVTDRKGQRQISRRYTQFITWRSKLVELWPAIIFEMFPNKTLIGVSEVDLIRNRSQYISRFLRSLSRHQAIYYSEQSQNFLNNTQENNLQAYLLSIPVPKNAEIFEKYKTAFPTEYEFSLKQDFLYKKDEVAASLQAYETYFSSKKIDLSECLEGIRRMAESKQRYFKALNKLTSSLLPSYQDLIYRWIQGQPLPKSPPSIMERMSLKTLAVKQSQTQKKPENQAVQGQPRQRKLSKQLQKESQEPKLGLFSSEAYKSRFEDTTSQIEDYNAASWRIYNVLKFELKEIDSVVGAIQQIKAVGRQIEHLKRTINVNKKQVEALNSNKTTLKTFFMDGNRDEKMLKLTNQNQSIQQTLQKLQEFYYLLSVLLQLQIKKYNQERADFYKNSLKKAFNEDLRMSRKLMHFYVFEEQLLTKEIQQRINLMRESSNPLKQPEQKAQEQAKQ